MDGTPKIAFALVKARMIYKFLIKSVGHGQKAEFMQSNIPYQHCLNCGTELKGMYCHNCGQEAASTTPTIKAFILEYLNNAYIWDPQFFKTIWTLIRRPGHLTNEFLSGKFISQEHPLKLNMFLLFVFITLFIFFAGPEQMNNSAQNITKNENIRSAVQFELLMDNGYAEKMKDSSLDTVQLMAPLSLSEKHPEFFNNLETIEEAEGETPAKWVAIVPLILVEEEIIIPDECGYYRFNPNNETVKDIEIANSVWSEMVRLLANYFPLLALFTAPILSMSLGFVLRKKKFPRIHHFIFALHYTAFLELLMLFIYILHLIVYQPYLFHHRTGDIFRDIHYSLRYYCHQTLKI